MNSMGQLSCQRLKMFGLYQHAHDQNPYQCNKIPQQSSIYKNYYNVASSFYCHQSIYKTLTE